MDSLIYGDAQGYFYILKERLFGEGRVNVLGQSKNTHPCFPRGQCVDIEYAVQDSIQSGSWEFGPQRTLDTIIS